MTAHDHREFIPGCFRCDLSRVETAATHVSTDVGALASLHRGLADLAAGRVCRLDDLLEEEDVD